MVFLEDMQKRRRAAPRGLVLKKRNEVWRTLDQRLAALGKTDADAFSELMMDQEVVLDDVTADELREIARAAEGVVAALQKEAEASSRDETVAAGLIFELEEMRGVWNGLKRRARRDDQKSRKDRSDK
ncbi:MAG: hypothetical protein WD407_08190 [Rhodospirillales bacterium]